MAFIASITNKVKYALSARSMAPVVIYHAVDHPNTNPLTTGDIHNVYPDILYEQILLLKKHFTILSIDEMAERIKRKKLNSGTASITFDDGYVSVINNAVPILEDLDVPATIFLTTKLIQSNTFWRDKVRYIINEGCIDDFLQFACEKAAEFDAIHPESFYRATKDPSIISSRRVEQIIDGFFAHESIDIASFSVNLYCSEDTLKNRSYRNHTFGNHTHSHYVLSSLDKDEQYGEVVQAETIINKMNLPRSRVFSIPFGQPRDFNDDTMDILHQLGYEAFAMSSGASIVNAFSESSPNIIRQGMIAIDRFMPENKNGF